MSWQSARQEAQRWLDRLNLPTRKLKGQSINLSAQAAGLRGEPKYIAMVIRAARRILKARGIDAVIDEPRPLGRVPPDDPGQEPTSDAS